MKMYHLLVAIAVLGYTLVLCGCSRQTRQEASPVMERAHQAPTAHMHETDEAAEMPAHHAEGLSGRVVNDIREIRVEAFKYGFKPDPIVVRKGEKVRLIAKSTDVKHGLGIEDFNINIELPPGEEKVVEFTPDKVGEFHIRCTVYCGPGHGDMHGALAVRE